MANTSAEALAELQAAQAAAKNPLDVYNEAVTASGANDVRTRVGSLRTTLLNTENAINQVDPSVTGRTSGSLVTEAQRSRLVNLERQPLVSQYGQQQGALTNEQATLTDLLGQAGNNSNLILQGQQQKVSNAKDTYSALTAAEAEQRRQAEADRAFQLQMQQFEESKKQFAAQLAASRAAASSKAAASAVTPQQARDQYNSSLSSIEGALKSYQAAGYRGDIGSRDATKNALIAQFRGYISPQEINGYVDTLYNRYYVR